MNKKSKEKEEKELSSQGVNEMEKDFLNESSNFGLFFNDINNYIKECNFFGNPLWEKSPRSEFFFIDKEEEIFPSKKIEILNNEEDKGRKSSSIESKSILFANELMHIIKDKDKETQKSKEVQNFKEKSTSEQTRKKIFSFEKVPKNISYRLDYYKKHFKVSFCHWMIKSLNELIRKSKFKKRIGKLSLPDSKLFTSNSNSEDNNSFLFQKVKDILTLEKNHSITKEKPIYKIREKNKTKIDNIFNKKYKNENKKTYYELIQFLEMTIENAYKKFYNTEEEFKTFSKDKKTLFYDEFFKKEKGYSLIEKYGFITLCFNGRKKQGGQ